MLLRTPSAERVGSREGPSSGGRETTYTPAISRPNPSRSLRDTWASACGNSAASAHAAAIVSTTTRTCHLCWNMVPFSSPGAYRVNVNVSDRLQLFETYD